MSNRWRPFAALAGIVGLVGAIAVTSGHGPGLDPDSMAYVGAAASLARGDGLQVPLGKWEGRDSTVALTVWPPAFPAAMAVPERLGIEPLTSARIVIALAAATTATLAVLVLAGAVTPIVAATGVLAILVTPSFVAVHLNVLSEPLFLATMMLTLYGMVSQRPWVAAAGAVGAVLTRYAGVSAGAAAALWFFFLTPGAVREKFRRAAISAAPAAAAFCAWIVHNSRVTVVQSPIGISYHSGIRSAVLQGSETTREMITPGLAGFPGWMLAVAVVVFLGVAIARARSAPTADGGEVKRSSLITRASAVLLLSYVGVLICSRLFVGGGIQFDKRLLSPVYLLAVLMLIPTLTRAARLGAPALRIVIGTIVCAWIAAAVAADSGPINDSIGDGNDFAASDWRDSPTIEWVKNEGSGHAIYTNWPPAVYFNAHRAAFDIPTSESADTLALFQKRIVEANGVFVAFDVRNFDYPASDSLARASGLVELKRFADGTVWAPRR